MRAASSRARPSAADMKAALESLNRRGRARSKYRAEPTTVDGIRFASKKEARRYTELKMLEKAGKIRSLQLQPNFPLFVGDWCLGEYRADFRYERFCWPGKSRECETIIEDVKGFRTTLYRWKKKHVEAQYGITIREL